MQPSAQRRRVRSSLPAGTRIGRYTVVERIAAGGMAELFLARQDGPRGFAKPIALKLLHEHIAENPEFVAMFEREARVAAALVHPNIAQVLDVGVADGEHFLALEFVHGRDLRRILAAQRGPLPMGCAIRIVADLAKALSYAHSKRDAQGRSIDLVHRDVSPANVLVGFSGSVKLADFGIAKVADQTAHTRTGTLKGKFGYMAPEQYLQQTVDPRCDLFALGVVLYETTTGRRAFAGAQTFSIMNKALAGDYARPQAVIDGYPTELARIVERLLAVEPSHRPGWAQEVVDALEAFARQSELDTRIDALGAFVSDLFDHPPEPSLETPTVPSQAAVWATRPDDISTLSSTRHRRWLPRLASRMTIATVGIAIGAVTGWRMAGGSVEQADGARPPEEQAASVNGVEPVRAPLAPEAELPVPPPAVANEATAEPRPTAKAEPASARTQGDGAHKPRRRARRRKSSKGERKPEPTGSDPETSTGPGLSEMFPKAMQ